MNAHPHSVPLPSPAAAPDLPAARDFAQNLMRAATVLLPQFEAGKPIDAAILRSAMEDAFGTSDSNGAWVWKDAYEAAEVAQILIANGTKFGRKPKLIDHQRQFARDRMANGETCRAIAKDLGVAHTRISRLR
ncbi:MAG: helix-turn-helix domain-containing protein [Yoonia sp.]